MGRRILLSTLALIAAALAPYAIGQGLGAAPVPPTVQVVDYGPTGQVAGELTHIKVRFSRPMGFFEQSEAQTPTTLLRITPAIAGRLYWMAPDLLAFESDAPLPAATAFDVELRPSLAGADGAKVENPPRWRFETARPACEARELRWERRGWLAAEDPIVLECNQAPVPGSLPKTVSVRAAGRDLPVRFGLSRDDAKVVAVQPVGAWPLGAQLALLVRTGLRSHAGPLPSAAAYRANFVVAPAPGAVDIACRNQIVLRFATPLSDRAWSALRIEPPLGKDQDRPHWTQTKAMPEGRYLWRAHLPVPAPGTRYTVTVPAGSEDIYGQKTASAWQREVFCPVPEETPYLELGRPFPYEPLVGVFEAAKPRTAILQTKAIREARLEYATLDRARTQRKLVALGEKHPSRRTGDRQVCRHRDAGA